MKISFTLATAALTGSAFVAGQAVRTVPQKPTSARPQCQVYSDGCLPDLTLLNNITFPAASSSSGTATPTPTSTASTRSGAQPTSTKKGPYPEEAPDKCCTCSVCQRSDEQTGPGFERRWYCGPLSAQTIQGASNVCDLASISEDILKAHPAVNPPPVSQDPSSSARSLTGSRIVYHQCSSTVSFVAFLIQCRHLN